MREKKHTMTNKETQQKQIIYSRKDFKGNNSRGIHLTVKRFICSLSLNTIHAKNPISVKESLFKTITIFGIGLMVTASENWKQMLCYHNISNLTLHSLKWQGLTPQRNCSYKSS